MFGEHREQDGINPVNTACFHGQEPYTYEANNTPALDWILTKIKPTIKRIDDETQSIMINNGLTDLIRNMIKMKDQCELERVDVNMSKILGTIFFLINSFYKANIA